MSIIRPFGSNALPTTLYEPFSFTITPPPLGTSTLTTSNTSGIPPGYLVNNGSNIVFAALSNGMNTGTEEFTITARNGGGTIIGVSSNIVSIAAGRFVDPSGNGFAGSNYTFFKNEPIPPIRLVAPFAISVPTSVPSLPPGLTYSNVSPTTFDIVGTPLVTVPQSNYLVIGKATGSNLGKIITSQFGISVGNERVLLNLSGTPIISPMTVGTAITPRVLTALFPPYPSGGTLRYSWPGVPDGIVVTDSSSTLTISGTPTIAAANAFRDAGISNVTVPFTATRTSPLPQISNVSNITFQFGPTVLFDTVNVPILYSGVALDPSATFFRAQTYFGSSSDISNIFSPNLRSDLSINFVPSQGRGYLFSPTTPGAPIGTASFTIRAINSNLIERDLSVPITVAEDVVTFSLPPPIPVDICYNFILSRPASDGLEGYYPSTIQFQARAASGNAIVFTTSGLAGTGLVLSNVSSNTVQITGIPNTVTPLSPVTITASAVGTPASASRVIQLAVLNDVINISDVSSLTFVQNRTITPIQLTATTLSTRPVTSFSSANLPIGFSLSTTGLLTGAPTDSTATPQTFTVTASTGFASQNRTYTYSSVADNILVLIPTTTVTTPITFSNVEFDVVTYSGGSGTLIPYFGPQGLVPHQNPSATLSVTGSNLLSGDFSGLNALAKQYRFQASGQAGIITDGNQVNIDVANVSNWTLALTADLIVPPTAPPLQAPPSLIGRINISSDEPVTFPNQYGYTPVATGPTFNTGPGDSNTSTTYFFETQGNGYDVARSSNTVVAVIGSNIIRSTDYGVTWESGKFSFPNDMYGPQWSGYSNSFIAGPPRARFDKPIFGSVATDGSSNWYAIGCGSTNTIDRDTGAEIWLPQSLVAVSTDNGLVWSTTRITPISSIDGLNDKLAYNQGRLFATRSDAGTPGTSVTAIDLSAVYYADVSDITKWYTPITPLTYAGGLAGSNSTLFAVGGEPGGFGVQAITAISTDNGETWATGSNIIPTPPSNTRYDDIMYSSGNWVASGMSNGFGMFRWSSNLTSWTSLLPEGATSGAYTAVGDTGFSALASYYGGTDPAWRGSLLDSSGGLVESTPITVSSTVLGLTKKLLPMSFSVGEPTLTFSIPYDPIGITFTEPTQSTFTNWQFVPIPTIPVQAIIPIPGDFIYYYAAGLPRGLTLNLDASGIEASITGTSSQFSDAYGRTILYAATRPVGGGGGVAAKQISFRTILPTVEKHQTGAGAFTSLLRQYTVVNAAQNSVNGRALPATEPPLGEFTRPHPPDSVSATGDPNCAKKC